MERLDAFMARANAAYYATRDPFADFTTAPEISQVFGELLGVWAAVTWDMLGRPSPDIYQALRTTVCAHLDPSQCIPRYPSELYEACLEGLVLFLVMLLLSRRESLRERFGWLTGAFLIGYGIARTTCEFFRAPDFFLRFLVVDFGLSMGQILCIPMLAAGIGLIWYASRRDPVPALH